MTQQDIDNDRFRNMVCDAFGCVAAATTRIELEVGNGYITLNVCATCADYFKEDERNGISDNSSGNRLPVDCFTDKGLKI